MCFWPRASFDFGVMPRYLDAKCEKQPEISLCKYLDEVRRTNASDFLWANNSLNDRAPRLILRIARSTRCLSGTPLCAMQRKWYQDGLKVRLATFLITTTSFLNNFGPFFPPASDAIRQYYPWSIWGATFWHVSNRMLLRYGGTLGYVLR